MAHLLTAHAREVMAKHLRAEVASVVFFDADGKELVVVNDDAEVNALVELVEVVDR